MSRFDAEVWDSALEHGVLKPLRVVYDATVGGRGVEEVAMGEEFRPMWATLLSKRVDAVVWLQDGVWVVEVKPVAGMSALGQVLSYTRLWNSAVPGDKQARGMVLCGECDRDMVEVFAAHGVRVVEVGRWTG